MNWKQMKQQQIAATPDTELTVGDKILLLLFIVKHKWLSNSFH